MTKKTAWQWCSKYIKLRDTIEDFPKSKDLGTVLCRTCQKWLLRISQESQAGHFIGRGLGGGSGVKWDERNIHTQCYQCNRFQQGAPATYLKFMLGKYGQKVVDELYLRHKVHKYTRLEIEGLGLYYKAEYQRMCREHNLKA